MTTARVFKLDGIKYAFERIKYRVRRKYAAEVIFDLNGNMRTSAYFSNGVEKMTSNAYSFETLLDVGAAFRQLRKQAGKTQVEVAASAGMRQEALSRFESGRSADFSLSKLLRLLRAVDAEMDFKASGPRRPTLTTVLEERRSNANLGPDAR